MTEERPNGYRLIIPPGWVRIPLRDGTSDAVEDVVFSRLRNLPTEVSKDAGMNYRLAVRRSLTRQIAEARKAGGLDLYLPLTTRYGIPLAASFLVSEHTASASDVVESVVHDRRGDEGRTSGHELAGGQAVRHEHVCAADPEQEVPVATRRVEYVLSVPRDPGRLVSVVFSTAGDGLTDSAFTTALVELFDASMLTFRWTRDGADLIPAERTDR